MKDYKALKNKLNGIYGINGRKPCDLKALYREYILAHKCSCYIDSDAVYNINRERLDD